ncbi:MAG: hypothetical protein HYX92_01120 [Chloroflexi bacterium]|nr:hypothetical protein [Chloroflexota bacterium]
MADLAVAEYPGAIQLHTDAEIRDNLERVVLDRIIDGLTKPAPTRGQASDVASSARSRGEIVFRGTLEDVNAFFLEKRWTDRFPIIPPTPRRVEEFLKYTDRSSDDEIAILPQANLRATPRNIAVNAVMAGCRPEYMPLLIAAVKAIGDPDFQLMSIGSTGCKTPWLLVNGPIIKRLGIQHGIATRSLGPNPTIGRAFGLIIHNIAGFRPGETAMGSWGYYTPFVLAEDEDSCDEIGWRPYHVEHGFGRNASTVTARTTIYWGGQTPFTAWGGEIPANAPKVPLAESILKLTCAHQQRQVQPEIALRFGDRNMVAVLLTASMAKVLAEAGYSKRDVEQYVWQNTRVSIREVNDIMQNFAGFGLAVHDLVKEGTLPEWFDMAPDKTIPQLADAEAISVVVCGDPHKDKVMSLWCNYNRPVTKEIDLPAQWDDLLRERKR